MPSTGRDTVLEPERARSSSSPPARRSPRRFTPVQDPAGKPKPWDIEFGFADGKLWLFQCRPFLGNDQLKNIPALAPLEARAGQKGTDNDSRWRRSSDDVPSRCASLLLVALAARWRLASRRAALDATETDVGRQRAAAGRLLPLVRAVLLRRLRAADAGSRPALHIELSRGNQVRVTMVLGDAELDAYLDDLALRRKIVPGADRRGRHRAHHQQASTSASSSALDEAGSPRPGGARERGRDHGRRAVEIMTRSTPSASSASSIPLDAVSRSWQPSCRPRRRRARPTRRLDAANAAPPRPHRPDRAHARDLDAALAARDRRARAGRTRRRRRFREQAGAFLDKATGGHYRVARRRRARRSSSPPSTRPAPSRRRRRTRARSCPTSASPASGRSSAAPRVAARLGMVDYLSPNPGYGFISMLPLPVRRRHHLQRLPQRRRALPARTRRRSCRAAWRKVAERARPAKPYQNLWIVEPRPDLARLHAARAPAT